MTAQRQQMNAPFAEEELRTFQGRGGKTMTYIEDETVMDRLDVGYGPGNWQIQVDPIPTSPNVVKVRLGVLEDREWVWYEDFGYPNGTEGESLKEAVSDGIRRCGRYVGIARDLYRKSTYEQGGALAPKPARAARTNGAAKPTPTHSATLAPEMDEADADELFRQSQEQPERAWDYAVFREAVKASGKRPQLAEVATAGSKLFPTKGLELHEPKAWTLTDREWRQLAVALGVIQP